MTANSSETTCPVTAEKKFERRDADTLPAWFYMTAVYAEELNRMAGTDTQLCSATGYCRSPKAHLSNL